MPKSMIESYHTSESSLVSNEKIILNVIGEERAKILCNHKELQNIDVVYTSNCVRTLQTAKYLLENQNLKANIDDRLDERRVGKRNDDIYPDWLFRQFLDPTFKTEGGESQIDVQNRFSEVIDEILKKYKNKRIAVFSHGYAILFYLLKYCKLLEINEERIKIEFNGKVFFDKRINAPELFKIIIDDNQEIREIELINIKELPQMKGI